jgi:ribosomal protein S6--L-glutamate ligase
MRLSFLLVRRVPPRPSLVLVEVFADLRRRGYEVEAGIPEDQVRRPDDLGPDHDLYVLKSHTELALSLAAVLHDRGARLLNPYPSCLLAQDKITAVARLRAAGVPAPRSWVTGDLSLLRAEAAERPLVVKPHRGHRGAGVVVVRGPGDLDRLALDLVPEQPVIVQEFVPGDGLDTKLYVVGDEVFCVRKPFSADSFTRPGVPAPVTPELEDLARRCGRAFGLGLYGLDVVEGPDGPVVVDVNYFPGYKGVPGVAPLIAEYVAGCAEGRYRLEPSPHAAATTPA